MIKQAFLKAGASVRIFICWTVSSNTEGRNIPGLLLFIDFEKAFDTLEWPFISKTLQHFGFGPSLLNWIELFYCNIESCILNNGWASNFFKLSRGVRQGCPLSPYLFILSAEILADAIRKKQRIKGIEINGIDFKLSQYADDTTLILDGSEESFLESVILIETFGNISGLRLNIKKTEALWIGSKKDCDLKLLPEKDFKWPKKKVKALGVWLSTDPNIIISLNYKKKKMKKIDRSLNAGNLLQTYIIRENSSFKEPGCISFSLHILTFAN